MTHDKFYLLALSRVAGIGPIRLKKILESELNAEQIFNQNKKYLTSQLGLSIQLAENIKKFNLFSEIENEINFCLKNNIEIISIQDEDYPCQLINCIDAPSFLFFKGNYQFNQTKMISIIGTRNCSEYGKRICEDLISDLQPYGVTIVSGLAYGIDIIAHKQSIKQNIPTIGVLAHSLDAIYPPIHKNYADEMLQNGGLLCEYFSNTKPDKGNFPTRNRIVAGMSEATIVIETDIKGGSMITAELANSYNKELFCFPGRVSDAKSAGCNLLIKSLKASLITNAKDVVQSLGWDKKYKSKPAQRQLFIELTEDERIIMNILNEKDNLHIDELQTKSQLNSTQIATCLLSLEMQNIVSVKPGKLVALLN